MSTCHLGSYWASASLLSGHTLGPLGSPKASLPAEPGHTAASWLGPREGPPRGSSSSSHSQEGAPSRLPWSRAAGGSITTGLAAGWAHSAGTFAC